MSERITYRLLDLSDDVRRVLLLSRLVAMASHGWVDDKDGAAMAALGVMLEEEIEAIETNLDRIIGDMGEAA